jgi:hypothetical protein
VNWKVVVLPEFYYDLEETGDWYEQKLQGLVQIHAGVLLWSDAFESGKRKNWHRILRNWVSRSFRRVIAERR